MTESDHNIAVRVSNLGKCYQIYDRPNDRLKQFVVPRLQHIFGQTPQQYYRDFWALKDVSFEVKKGETVGIIGRNGSGKSTLLQMICGTLSATNGSVATRGRIAALLELGSGFNYEFTGRENVFMNGAILGLSQEEIKARFEAIAAFADINDFIEQPVKIYSSGMVLRLAFAVAINVNPEILVIDEALAVGDVGFQARCFAKISDLKQRGVTLLFVSHSPSAVTQLCDRAILLDRGELLLLGAPYQAIRGYNHLANAGQSSFEEVREEIVALAKTENSEQVNTVDKITLINRSDQKVSDANRSIEAFYDQQLHDAIKPLPFKQRGGEISNYFISDLSDHIVNILPMHHKFSLNFNVRFDDSFENVRFAWVVKSTNGLILGGGSTHQPGAGISVSRHTNLKVSSYFVNIFNPGSYIIDIGVRGIIDQDNEFVHNISNAIALRSVSYNVNFRTGLVDCLVFPSFKLEDDSGNIISWHISPITSSGL